MKTSAFGQMLSRINWTGFFTAVGAIGTCLGVFVAAQQLADLNRTARIDRANTAVKEFASSSEVKSRADTVREASSNGHDYTQLAKNDKAMVGLREIMNQLELISGYVNRCYYDEDAVFSTLGKTIFKATKAHLLGESGKIDEINYWEAAKLSPFGDQYPELRIAYKRWFPNGAYVGQLPVSAKLKC